MGKYIITLISVALLSGIMGMLSPEGDIKKYVRLAGSLCLLCALAVPVWSFISEGGVDIDGFFSFSGEVDTGYEEIYREALADGARENAEVALKAGLAENFELSADSFDVELGVEYDGEKYYISTARVLLHNSAVFADPRDISAYVNESCGCSCTVEYD